jgi:hypothetical protein
VGVAWGAFEVEVLATAGAAIVLPRVADLVGLISSRTTVID